MADADNNNGNNGAGLVDAAAGVGSGAFVAASVSTIYGMTKLKKLDPMDVLKTVLATSKEHGEKIAASLKDVVMKSPLAGIQVDPEKLKTGVAGVFQKYGIEIKDADADLEAKISARLNGINAEQLAADLREAVAGSMDISGAKINPQGMKEILGTLGKALTGKDGEGVSQFLEALEKNGLKFDKELLNETLTKIIKTVPSVKAGIIEDIKAAWSSEKLKPVFNELGQAVADNATVPGKTAEEIKNIIAGGPESITAQLQAMISDVYSKGKSAVMGGLKDALPPLEDAGRTLMGSVKYKHASWYQKPFVAFEAMSTKGKVGMGTAVVGATALGTWATSKMHRGSSHAESVQNAASSSTERSAS